MPIFYKLILCVMLFTGMQGFAANANALSPVSATKKDRPMNKGNEQDAPLTQEEFESAAAEAEALYGRGENAKAATILIQLMERAENDHAREIMAMAILSFPLPPELVLRFARAANGNGQILDELLQKATGLPSAIVNEIVGLRDGSRNQLFMEGKALREAETLYERGGASAEAEATLIQIIETTRNDEMRKNAVWVLSRRPVRPDLAMRCARAAKETDVFFALLSESAALPPDTVRDLMTWVVKNGYLDTNTEFSSAAERGAIPDDFVPSIFSSATDGMRHALLVMASAQLQARGDKRLHGFMLNVVYGDYSQDTRDSAGLYLDLAYQNSMLEHDRFRIEKTYIQNYFGSVSEFIVRLVALLRAPKSLGEYSSARKHVVYAFNEADPSVASVFFSEEAATHKLVRTLLNSIGEDNFPQDLRDSMLKFLRIIGTHAHWRSEVTTGLFKLAGRKNDEAQLDAAVNALAGVTNQIDLTEADPKKDGTIGDRLADRVGQMVATSPAVMLRLAREFHKIKINDHARQRILAQLLAISMTRNDDEALAAVMKLIPSVVSNPILAYNLACTAARQKDRDAVFKYAKLALTLGKLAEQFRADTDFAPYLRDKEFTGLLDASQ